MSVLCFGIVVDVIWTELTTTTNKGEAMTTLTNKEFDFLSETAKAEIAELIKHRETTIAGLKKRIESLSYHNIDYRSDNNDLELSDDNSFLIFKIWEKTAGEEWGNCAGREIQIKVGTKYTRAEIEFFATNSQTSYSTEYIDLEEIDKLVYLLEDAFGYENEVDRDKLIISACKKIVKLAVPELDYCY